MPTPTTAAVLAHFPALVITEYWRVGETVIGFDATIGPDESLSAEYPAVIDASPLAIQLFG